MGLSDHLKSLGSSQTKYHHDGPYKELLEWFENPMPKVGSTIEVRAPEFTSLCPKTGQPDFATIFLSYQPDDRCLESKSWKLYLGSFRQAKMFHESCVTQMAIDLIELLDPVSLTIRGEFTPRGGISFWPTVSHFKAGVPELENETWIK